MKDKPTPEPIHPKFKDPSAAWRWWGFALIVMGLAGLLFHWVQGLALMTTGEGKASVAVLALGVALMAVGLVKKRR